MPRANMKRRRNADRLEAHEQKEQEETALEVDIMILDYTAHYAAESAFKSVKDGQQDVIEDEDEPGRTLAIFHSFFTLFKRRRPTYTVDAQLQFRILLLKFLTLYMEWSKPSPAAPSLSSLTNMRDLNKKRAYDWIGVPGRVPSSGFDVTVFDTQLSPQDRQPVHGPDTREAQNQIMAKVSLLDILPLFMQVSAILNKIFGSVLIKDWMRLAGEFMLQASLEQYLVFSASGTDAIDEAFAWGYKPKNLGKQDGSSTDTDEPHDCSLMFTEDGREAEIAGWAGIRFSFLTKIFPDQRRNNKRDSTRLHLTAHLKNIAASHPMAQFNITLLSFMEAIGKSTDEPVLVQLEKGKLTGMDEDETQRFLESCGVAGGGLRFFDSPAGFRGT